MAGPRKRFDLNLLERQIDHRVDEIVDGLEGEMQDIVDAGAEQMQTIIDTAITPTGERRVASGAGSHAGRRETDSMYEDVRAEKVERDGNTLIGRFGWTKNFEDYYSWQERIDGMDALGQSAIQAEDRLRGIIKRVR